MQVLRKEQNLLFMNNARFLLDRCIPAGSWDAARRCLEIDKKAPTSTSVGVGAFIVFVDLLLL